MTAIRVPDLEAADPQEYREALDFLYDRINYERISAETLRYPFRLRRMRSLLQRLRLEKYVHDPARRGEVPLVHLAGTKGKGSTAAMVAAGLTASGLKTGLYTSPHLNRLEERFRIDGECCPQAELVRLALRLRDALEAGTGSSTESASFFELTTALALMHFDAAGCDAIVLEVGLGGRLDSTNVCSPHVTSITSIGLDHQHVLGDTLEKIAVEKAGIIKRGIPVVSGVRQPHVAEVIRRIASQRQATVYEVDRDFSWRSEGDPDWGSRVSYHGGGPEPVSLAVDVPLEGDHQAANAAVAITCLGLLKDQGVPVRWPAVGNGLATLTCPGRIERFAMPAGATAVIDAAHNDGSIEALCRCLRHRFGSRKITVVFGTSRDKSAAPMLAELSTVADHLLLTRYQTNPRHFATERLLELVPEAMRPRTTVLEDPIHACTRGLDQAMPGGVLVVCGSFFLVAETRDYLARLAVAPQ